MEADYKVKLEVFEGPLDLLLYLIKQDEIDIYDISLERITRQYPRLFAHWAWAHGSWWSG